MSIFIPLFPRFVSSSCLSHLGSCEPCPLFQAATDASTRFIIYLVSPTVTPSPSPLFSYPLSPGIPSCCSLSIFLSGTSFVRSGGREAFLGRPGREKPPVLVLLLLLVVVPLPVAEELETSQAFSVESNPLSAFCHTQSRLERKFLLLGPRGGTKVATFEILLREREQLSRCCCHRCWQPLLLVHRQERRQEPTSFSPRKSLYGKPSNLEFDVPPGVGR